MNRGVRTSIIAVMAAAVVVFSATAGAQDLSGRWILGEVGEEMAATLEVTGTTGTATQLRPHGDDPQTAPLTLAPVSPSLYQLVVAPVGERPMSLFVVPSGNDSALVMEPGDDDLMIMRRLTEPSEEMLGAWLVEGPGRSEVVQVTLTSDTATIARAGGVVVTSAFFPVSTSSTTDVVFGFRSSELELYRLHAIGEGVYVAWRDGEDDYMAVYREGQRPGWLLDRP